MEKNYAKKIYKICRNNKRCIKEIKQKENNAEIDEFYL